MRSSGILIFLLSFFLTQSSWAGNKNLEAIACFEAVAEQVPCSGLDATVRITVTGGLAPFQYSYNGVPQASPVFNNLPYGTLNFIVEDATGCVINITANTVVYNVKKPTVSGLMVNEIYNGPLATFDYIELAVLGEPGGKTDIRNWIVDDNNGDFGSDGITPGHFKFSGSPVWANVPVGSLIIISENPDLTELSIDSINKQYIIPAASTYISKCGNSPLLTNPNYLATCTAFGGTAWNLITLGSSDAVQVRRPNGTFFHGLSFTNTNSVNTSGGPDNIRFDTPNPFVIYFDNKQIRNKNNFYVDLSFASSSTLGKPNQLDNSFYIDSLRNPFLEDIVLALPPDFDLCDRDTVFLDAGFPGGTYLWNTGATTRKIRVTQGGTYSVRMTTPAGCKPQKQVVVSLKPRPIASASADSLRCIGTDLALLGTANLVGFNSEWIGPNSFSDFTPNPIIANVQKLNSGNYQFIASLGICTDTFQINVSVIDTPFIGTSSNLSICESSEPLNLNSLLSGTTTMAGKWFSFPAANANLSDSTFNVPGAGLGLFNFKFLIDIAACFKDSVVTAVRVVDKIRPISAVSNCVLDRSEYSVDYIFEGGDSTSFNSLEAITIASAGAGKFKLKSVNFPSGDTARIYINDASDCVADTFKILRSCDCISNPGTMKQTLLNLPCGVELVSAVFNNDALVDLPYGDKLRFVLHEGSGNIIVNPIAFSDAPTFSFNAATMQYAKTYYISSYIEPGNFMGSGVNAACRVVAIGTPVIFNDRPRAKITGGGTFCEGDPVGANINYTFTGTPPFRLIYQVNGQLKDTLFNGLSFNTFLTTSTQVNLFALSDFNCQGVVSNDTVRITVKNKPIPNAGTDFSICGLSANLSAKPSFGTGKWTEATGQARFANFNSPSSAVIVPNVGEYEFKWTETNAPCPAAFDLVKVKFLSKPTANAGKDTSVCGRQVQLNAKASIGNGLWQNALPLAQGEIINASNPKAIFKAPAAGTYTLVWRESVDDICISTDTVRLTFYDTISASISAPLCNNTATGFQFDIAVAGGISNSYLVNDVKINGATYRTPEIKNNEAYRFEIIDSSGCGQVVFQGMYTCPCISKSGNMTTDTIKACEQDVFFAGFDNGNVLDANDTMLFVLHDGSANNLGNVFSASRFNSYTKPFAAQFNTVYYASTVVGNRTFSGLGIDRNDRCLSVAKGQAVIFTKSVKFDFVPKLLYCRGDSVFLPYTISDTASYTLNYLENGVPKSKIISGGNGKIFLETTLVTNQIQLSELIAQDGNPCKIIGQGSAIITVADAPSLNITFNDSVCVGSAVKFFVSSDTDIRSVLWDFGDGQTSNQQLSYNTFQVEGKYLITLNLEGTNSCKNKRTDTVFVQQNPIASFSSNAFPYLNESKHVLCLPDTLKLSNTSSNGAYLGNTWSIENNVLATDVNAIAIYLVEGKDYQISLTERSTFGCSNTINKTIRGVRPSGELSFLKRMFCNEDSLKGKLINLKDVADFNISFSNQLTGQDTIFSDNDFSYFVNNAFGDNTIYLSLNLKSKEACTLSIKDSLTVVHSRADFAINSSLADSLSRCFVFQQQDTIIQQAVNAFDYRWTFGNGQVFTGKNPPLQYFNPGVYNISLEIADSSATCYKKKTRVLEIYALPKLTVNPFGITICDNGTAVFNASGGKYYSWLRAELFTYNEDSTTASLLPDQGPNTQPITVSTIDKNNCSDTVEFFIEYVALSKQEVIPFDSTIIIADTVTIDLTSDPRYTYTWLPADYISCDSCPITQFYPLVNQTYYLTVSDIFNCYQDFYEYNITVDDKFKLDMPDAFSPNADGVNEVIYPSGWGIGSIEVFDIFDRKGNKLYTSSGVAGPLIGWDGKYKGRAQAADNYYYFIQARKAGSNEIFTKNGSFQLIK